MGKRAGEGEDAGANKRHAGDSAIAVITVGGPTKGTRFRPLSLDCPKPLIPVAGRPMVHHPIHACKAIPNLKAIFLLGFYEEKEFALYISSLSTEIGVPVRYIKESKGLGSAGGLYAFREVLLEDSPSYVFVLNCDVCCSFPLAELLEAHQSHPGAMGTMLVKHVSAAKASECGEVVADPKTHELLHYTEKPETYVSDIINAGVYVFSSSVFDVIGGIVDGSAGGGGGMQRKGSYGALGDAVGRATDAPKGFVRLDQDLLTPFAGKKQMYVHESTGYWEQLKTPGLMLKCSDLYLSQYRQTSPDMLASNRAGGPSIVGNVYLHPSAKVHPTAKLGPNVAVAAGARIGAGVRLMETIVLDDVEVREHACVQNAIVGWKCVIGRWSRVQGTGDFDSKTGVTILGEDVVVADEVVVSGCIVLPHKEIKETVRDETIL